jgi:DNA-binding response OmpR family regulator
MDDQDMRLKIVIVEDNEYLSEIYKTRLEVIGYRCFTAADGEIALQIIEREKPALVLLDMMIPKIAGDEVLRRMRAEEWGKTIRVFIISNLNEVDAPAGLRELGIEGYAVKANLTDDDIDKLVDKILTPADQDEDLELDS